MIKDKENYLHSEITEQIIGEAFSVYNTLGIGFLERVYCKALAKSLIRKVLTKNHKRSQLSASS